MKYRPQIWTSDGENDNHVKDYRSMETTKRLVLIYQDQQKREFAQRMRDRPRTPSLVSALIHTGTWIKW